MGNRPAFDGICESPSRRAYRDGPSFSGLTDQI
jgi:hypothetical protein